MGYVLKLIRLVKSMDQFSRESQEFVQAASQSLGHQDAEYATSLRRTYGRIVRLTQGTVLFGCLAVPGVAPWLAVWFHGGKADAAALAVLQGVVISLIGPSLLYLFAGVALGCLVAPSDFLLSPAGVKWMELIGTKNVTGARLVCVLVVLAGSAVMVGIGAALMHVTSRHI
jgi:hypothetical protein